MKRWVVVLMVAAVALFTAGCEDSSQRKTSTRASGEKATEQAQQKFETAVPYPVTKLNDSIERRNLVDRLERFNKPDKIGYVYLKSASGVDQGYFVIKGKISSTESQLTPSDKQICTWGNSSRDCDIVQLPGDDGSYGPNESGVFFFTTEGALVQWNGDYLYSDVPLKVNSQPLNIAVK